MKNGLTWNFVWYENISYYSSGLTLQSKLPCLCSVCRGVPHNIGEACFFVQSIVWHLVFMDQIRTTGSEFLGILQMFYHSSNSLYPYTYMEHIQVLSITDHFRFDWNVMIRRTLQTNILNDFFVVLVPVGQIWFVFLLKQCPMQQQVLLHTICQLDFSIRHIKTKWVFSVSYTKTINFHLY